MEGLRSMAATKPRIEQRHRRAKSRQRILSAARELFAQRGYGRTTMAAIAARAGVVRATVYNNFNDKVEILAEIIREYMHGYVVIGRQLQERVRPDQTVFEFLEAMVRESIAWRIANGDIRGVIDVAKHTSGSGWKKANAAADAAMLGWIRSIHEANAERGLTRPDLDIGFATQAVYSMIETTLSGFDVSSPSEDVDRVAHQLTLLHWHAIYDLDPRDSPLIGPTAEEHPTMPESASRVR
jgi:AcrR family transcriptional regulator